MEREENGLPITTVRGKEYFSFLLLLLAAGIDSVWSHSLLTEISLLKSLSHPNIVRLHEVVVGQKEDRCHSHPYFSR
jgi:serine/threonine protein kinase